MGGYIESQNKNLKSDFDFSVHYFVMFCFEVQSTRPHPFFAPITVRALYDDVLAVKARWIGIQLIELSTGGVPGGGGVSENSDLRPLSLLRAPLLHATRHVPFWIFGETVLVGFFKH